MSNTQERIESGKTKIHRDKLSKSLKKYWENNPEKRREKSILLKNNKLNWKGEKAGYSAVHMWLHAHYGKANKCENRNCLGKSNNYNWALKKGKKYEHNVENFSMLCRSCHSKQDITKEGLRRISNFLKGRLSPKKGKSEKKKNIVCGNCHNIFFNYPRRSFCSKSCVAYYKWSNKIFIKI